MTTILKTTMLAAVVAGSLGSTAVAMDMEFNMLTGAVFNELKSRGLPTENIDTLTLSDIAVIKGIIDSDESEGEKTNRIQAILER